MAFEIIWEYDVPSPSQPAFRDAHGPSGAWVSLFSQASGYMATSLLQGVQRSTQFITIDKWETREAFLEFWERYQFDYEALDVSLAHLSIAETKIGEFQELD